MCGGSSSSQFQQRLAMGLSPRVRGKPPQSLSSSAAFRSIPACAGEARQRAFRFPRRWVYPRVCGGSAAPLSWLSVGWGLSPRVRGKLPFGAVVAAGARSIPACAGEANTSGRSAWGSGVYPRVCGGSFMPADGQPASLGLSPRVRGKPPLGTSPILHGGSIPACAGEATEVVHSRSNGWVYPRVCGGSGFCWM